MNFGFNRSNQVQRPNPIRPNRGEGCKIKIKNTSKGREISFEGQCTKEQLEMAKSGIVNEDSKEEDD